MWSWLVPIGLAAAFSLGWMLALRRWRTVDWPAPTPRTDAAESSPPAVNDVLEELHLGIAISGRDGVGEFRNSAAKAMAGTHAGILIDDAIARHLARGLVGIRSDEMIELQGHPSVTYVVRSSPLPGGGSVCFLEDTSERRRTDQVRTDFVANISHELKTPIGALSVLAETLQAETDPATVRRFAERMLAEAERAANTVDDLMELTRIELDGDAIVDSVRVADVVDGAIDRARELAAHRSITISALDPVDHGGRRSDVLMIAGDARQLVSAVGNLVENAVKYSDPGGSVQVRVRHDAGMVEIAVVDQGVGIPAHAVDRVFERFYRVDQARSRDTGGTGLGLSIVRHVATNHGGTVDVSSSEGEGSTFTLRVPVATGRSTHIEAAQQVDAVDDQRAVDPGDAGVA